ncbi:MAG TPA: hypothetical protein PLQ00_09005, partial [Thermoguttaceae bacterium]|nr:hypothetical protein [Thermoguttaceae bacterium]
CYEKRKMRNTSFPARKAFILIPPISEEKQAHQRLLPREFPPQKSKGPRKQIKNLHVFSGVFSRDKEQGVWE